MFRWIPYAFVRIVVFFCAGILLAIYRPDYLTEPTAQLLFLTCCLLYLILAFAYHKLKINPGIPGVAAVFLAGYVNVQLQTDSRRLDHIINLQIPIEYYTAIITKPAEEKDRSWKLEARIADVKTDRGWSTQQGKILLYTRKEDFRDPFRYGDVVLIKGTPQVIQPPSNPGEFDYKRFLTFKKVYHQHYVKGENVKYLENAPPNVFMQYAISARTWADSILKKFIHGDREQALASGLVLGVTDGLDNELLNAYAATGAMHVLSVSGLHVGIIYWMILLLFKPFHKIKSAMWILAGLSLLILWAYAFVTGISPSVLRAVTMFSFVAIARTWNQRTNIYNILAASAFCLLLYDPHMIMSVGFQLSYLAVLGIVSLQPGLYRLWEPKQRLWDEVWKISAVSIAAQLATFSLGLLYFHQFPNYFLLSNLFVIPGSFIVLILGLVILAVGFIHPLAGVLGWVLEWIIKALNGVVFAVEKFPFSLLENVYINTVQCWVLILMVVMIFLWVETKRFSWLIMVSFLCIIFSIAQWVHFREDVNVQKLTIYKVPGHTAIDFTRYGKAHFLTDSVLQKDMLKTKFHILPNRLIGGVKNILPCDPFSRQLEGCAIMVWCGKTILQIQHEQFWVPVKLDVDYMIISNNAVKNLTEVTAKVHAKEIILDSSNSFYNADKLLSESKKLNIEIFSVLHRGAFDLTI